MATAIVSVEFVKQYFNIQDTSLDDRISFFIPIVEADYLQIRNAPFAVDSNGDIVYPATAPETAAQMVMFKITATGKVTAANGAASIKKDTSSESWGDHSITYKTTDALNQSGDFMYGYPVDIVSKIQRYIKFREIRGCR